MKEIILMRHAEAESPSSVSEDFDRRLTADGRVQAQKAGAWLCGQGITIDKVIASPSFRTRQTAEHCCAMMDYPNRKIGWERIMYLAGSQQLRVCLERESKYDRVLLVAHNPGLENLCRALSNAPSNDFSIRFLPGSMARIRVRNAALGETSLFGKLSEQILHF